MRQSLGGRPQDLPDTEEWVEFESAAGGTVFLQLRLPSKKAP